jgi:hypothetical protein
MVLAKGTIIGIFLMGVAMRLPWLCLIFVFACPAAQAQNADLEQARQLSAEMKYPKALKLVDRVLKSSSSGPADLGQAYEIRGLSLAALGRNKKAMRAFRLLLALRPDYKLPDYVSPKLHPPFKKASKQAAKVGPLLLKHTPPKVGKRLAGQVLQVELPNNPLRMVAAVRLIYFAPEGKPKQAVRKVKKTGKLAFKLPSKLDLSRVHYYFTAENRHKGKLVLAGSADEPFVLKADEPALVQADPVVAAVEPGGNGPKLDPAGDSPADGDSEGDSPSDGASEGDAPSDGTPGDDSPSDGTAVEGDGQLLASSDPDLEGEASAAATDTDRGPGAPTPWFRTWWFWTGVGAVVVASVATGVALGVSGDGGGPIEYGVTIR